MEIDLFTEPGQHRERQTKSRPFAGEIVVREGDKCYHGGVQMSEDEVRELVDGGASLVDYDQAGPFQKMLVRDFKIGS